MANQHHLKWLDFRYHAKNPIFRNQVLPLMALTQKVKVYAKRNDGSFASVCQYVDINGHGKWVVYFPNVLVSVHNDAVEAVEYFEDTDNIDPNEWALFEMCQPEMNKAIGQMTYHTTDVELYLSGRVEIKVEYV